ncbi:MAG: ribbon-helix-helix protein, CopG family [Actinobacteria bacterium]|nr:ribbon-helix-helix protein, CopG family [Actinomycetota bacterium]
MTTKRINISISDKFLREIEDFCRSEKISKSLLIREATAQYISSVKEQQRKDRLEAMQIQKRLREKGKPFDFQAELRKARNN